MAPPGCSGSASWIRPNEQETHADLSETGADPAHAPGGRAGAGHVRLCGIRRTARRPAAVRGRRLRGGHREVPARVRGIPGQRPVTAGTPEETGRSPHPAFQQDRLGHSTEPPGRIHALDLRRRHDQQAARADELIQAGDWDEARRLVELVLQEDPSNARAMNARDRIRARDFERNASGDGLEAQFRMPVTLEFKDIPVRAVFDVLSQASGINFIYDPEIRPDAQVTVQLRKTPLDEAIRIIGMSTQLETMVINANSILVFPSTPQKISEYRQLSVRSFFLDTAQASTVAETIKTILKTDSLVVVENLDMMIIRDTPDAIRLAERLVQLHDTSAPEVVLEVEILEVNRTTLREMGVNLPKEIGVSVSADQSTSAWQTVDELRGINSSSLYANVPNASIKLNESTTNASILANPKIRVQNRESAKIMIGDKVPVITSTSTSTGFVPETVNSVD